MTAIIRVSNRNILKMSSGLAPVARRIPISLRRAFTFTYIRTETGTMTPTRVMPWEMSFRVSLASVMSYTYDIFSFQLSISASGNIVRSSSTLGSMSKGSSVRTRTSVAESVIRSRVSILFL